MPTIYDSLGRGGRGGGSGYTGGTGTGSSRAGTKPSTGRTVKSKAKPKTSPVNKKVKVSGVKVSTARKSDKAVTPTGPKKARIKKINDKRKTKNKEYFSDGILSEKYDTSFVTYRGKTKLNRGKTSDEYGVHSTIIRGKNWRAQEEARLKKVLARKSAAAQKAARLKNKNIPPF